MRPGGGGAKGAAFERQICKALSLWVTDGKRQDVFWRSAMSGGRSTVMGRRGVDIRQSGDICSVAPEGHALTDALYFELKHRKHFALDSFVVKSTGPLQKFWAKAQREAGRHKRKPVIIFRQNGWPILMLSHRNILSWDIPPLLTIADDLEIISFDALMGAIYDCTHYG